jgi:hypothetical protein
VNITRKIHHTERTSNPNFRPHPTYLNEKLDREKKIEMRNKEQTLILTNDDVLEILHTSQSPSPVEKETVGDLCKKGTTMASLLPKRRSW